MNATYLEDTTKRDISRVRIFAVAFMFLLLGTGIFSLMYDLIKNMPLTLEGKNIWEDLPHIIAYLVNLIFSCLGAIITVVAFKKYKSNHKTAPYLLFLMFLFLTFTMGVQVFYSMTTINSVAPEGSLFMEFLQSSVWLFLATSVFFQFLFILEIFKNGMFHEDNKAIIRFFVVIDFTLFGLILLSLLGGYFAIISEGVGEIIVLIGSAVAIVSLFVAFYIQTTQSFKIASSVQDDITRSSVRFIGFSGIFFLVSLLSEFFEELIRNILEGDLQALFVDFFTIIGPVTSLIGAILF